MKKQEEIALFKYGLISPVLYGNVEGQMAYFRQMSEKEFDVPYLGTKKFKPETFKKWLIQYRKNGLEGIMGKERSDKGSFRAIDDNLATEIKKLAEKYPDITTSAFYRILKAEGFVNEQGPSYNTVRDYINKNDLKKPATDTVPRHKFEKEHVNELWITDVMHGPYINDKGKKRKTFLITIIDDCTRMIVGKGWFFNENIYAFMTVLKEAIMLLGLSSLLYCDNGAVFVNNLLKLACARLGIGLIHSKPYDPRGRGKQERFYRTVRDKFIPFIDVSKIDIIDLNQQFEQWLNDDYHNVFHHGIDMTPMDKLMEQLKIITPNRVSKEELEMAFLATIYRHVKNDSTISINNTLYECPQQYIGKKIELRYPIDSPDNVTIYEQDKPLHKLNKVNIVENSKNPTIGIKFSSEEN